MMRCSIGAENDSTAFANGSVAAMPAPFSILIGSNRHGRILIGHEPVLTTGEFGLSAFTVTIEGVSRTLGGTGFRVAVTLEAALTWYEKVFCVLKFT
jgi:hypothetical protein